MTPPPPDGARLGATLPPPGCPAHTAAGDAPVRLHGAEAEADPSGVYEELRARHGAVAPVLLHGDLPAWLVLGYRENLDVMRSPARFSRDSRRWSAYREGRIAPDSPLNPMVAWQPLCVFADGADHKRLRGAVTQSMAKFDRRGIRRYVTRYADQLIDGFAPEGRVDLVGQFAEHLPMLVMTQLLGMPEEYGPRLVEAARDLMKGTETALASNDYVVATLRQLVERKRTTPGGDFVTWLIQHESALTEDEVLEHLRLILVAANETTVNLIADTLRLLLTDRRFRANLAGGHMTLPDALEQVLWDSPPLSIVPGRWATGDTVLAGQHIKEGDFLMLGLAAGNVDPDIRPDRSDSVDGNRSHLAFSGGPHECPGQDIGRAIAATGIETLLKRLPDLQLSIPEDELAWHSSWLSRHLAGLPAGFAPHRRTRGFVPGAEATRADRAAENVAGEARPIAEPGPMPGPGPMPAATPAPQTAASVGGRRSWWMSPFRRRR